MTDTTYRTYMHRVWQWIAIIAIIAAIAGGYYYFRSRAATTNVSDRAEFEAPLTTSINLARGQGTATFTRADGADLRASVTDFEGRVQKVKAGEARFEGARRVRNLLRWTEDFSNAVWVSLSAGTGSAAIKTNNYGVAPDGTTTAGRIQLDRGAGATAGDYSGVRQNAIAGTIISTDKIVISAWLKSNTGSNQVLSLNYGSGPSVTVTTTWQRYSYVQTNGASSYIDFITYGSGGLTQVIDILVWHPQLENVTGQANRNPSEYVSQDVLAAPYHGAGADGVKYFDTENANTLPSTCSAGVVACVVTEATSTTSVDGHASGSLPGASGSYFSTPDSAASSITGDIDIRLKVAMDDWTPAATVTLAAKYGTAGQQSWLFRLFTGGTLGWLTSADGTASTINLTSAATGIADGTVKWLRVTHDVDNGAAGNDVKFWTSNDGVSWTQLGSTATTAGTTSVFDGTMSVVLGTRSDGATDPATGKFYRAIILSGIDGTAKVDFDPSQWSSGTTFTSRTAEVWTKNGSSSFFKNSLKGYLAEGSRTNLLTQSEDFTHADWGSGSNITKTANATTAPDGTTTADKIEATATAATNNSRTTSLSTAGSASGIVYSIYAKQGTSATTANNFALYNITTSTVLVIANINFGTGVMTVTSGAGTAVATSVGNGWWRIVLTATASVANGDAIAVYVAFTGNSATAGDHSYVWGAQFESAVTFASSYIPTTTASVTRAADLLTYPIANIEAGKGALYLEGFYSHITSTQGVAVDISASTSTKLRIGKRVGGGGDTEFAFYVQDTAVDQAWLRPTAISANTLYRAAMRWSTNDFAVSLNGAAALTDTLGSVPANLDELAIGVDRGRTTPNFGTVKNVKIWKKTLTNTQLQNLAAGTVGATQASSVKVNRADFEADLTSTIDLQRGKGSATFTRADGADRRASVTDFEGIIRKVKAGEARFEGARRVENLISTSSESLTGAGAWSASNASAVTTSAVSPPAGYTTVTKITEDSTAGVIHGMYQSKTLVAGDTVIMSVVAKAAERSWMYIVEGNTMTSIAYFNLSTGAVGTVSGTGSPAGWIESLGGGWYRCFLKFTTTGTTGNIQIRTTTGDNVFTHNGDGASGIYATGAMFELIDGQANKNPSEYVSVGIKSAPYHGANVDGVKYFETENGNTVSASYVVTEATGPTLEGHAFGSLPGTSGAYFSTPDSSTLDITGDIDIRVKAILTDWTPSATQTLMGKYNGTGNQRSYNFGVAGGGALVLTSTADGSTVLSTSSTVANSVTDGTQKWVRVTLDVDDGSGNRVINFYTSENGESWTQLGSTVTTSGTTSLFNSSATGEIGSVNAGTAQILNGKVYRAIILSGINGVAKVDFDPSQWSSGTTFTSRTGEVWTDNGGAQLWKNSLKGYLAEGSRTNLLLRSEEADNASWTKQRSSITANTIAAPDGTTTADKIVEDATASATHRMYQGISKAGSALDYAGTIYAKAGERTWLYLGLVGSGETNGGYASFDLANGTVSATSGSFTNKSATITPVGNGWYRCTIMATSDTTTFVFLIPHIATGSGTYSYTGDGTSGLYLWGAQVEQATFASSYVPTTSASVTRAGDALTYPTSGNFSDTAGTAYAEAIYPYGSTNSSRLVGGAVGDNGAPIYSSVSGGLIYGGTYNVTNTATFPTGASNVNSSHKYAAKWTGSLMRSSIDGNIGAQSAYDGSYNLTAIGIGLGGGLPWFGPIKNVKIWQTALDDTTVTSLTSGTTGTVKQTSINVNQNDKQTSGLVGFWTFNGKDMTSTGAFDRSGQGNNGTLSGPTITEGKVGQALDFDGTDDAVSVSDVSALDVGDTADLTITGWFNRDTFATDDTMIAKRNGITATDTGYLAYIDDADDKLYFEVSDGTDEYQLASTSTFTVAGWNHFAIVWDQDSASATEIYVNGTADSATDTGTIGNIGDLSNTLSLLIGTETDAGNPYDGKIDEVRIYNTALSAPDIANLYNLGR